MLIVLPLALLLTYVYWRPQQVWESLQPLTLNMVVSLVLFGLVMDLRVGPTRLRGSPLLAFLCALLIWCLVTIAIKAPDALGESFARYAIALVVFVVISEGLQSLRALETAAAVLFAFTLGLAAFGVHQGLAPTQCYLRDTGPVYDAGGEITDGRPCTSRESCVEGGEPGAEYLCEHVGLLGTHSIAGRVRYRGILEDPNELSWAISMGIPLGFAFYERRRTRLRLLALVASLALGATTMVMSQSRSGQLGMLAMLGAYFVRRFKLRGALLAGALCLPLLLLGGRSGEAAQASTEERLACWNEALTMFRENPIFGVGASRFTENYYLTAHNSFLLALAELGPLGMFLWTSVVYFAFKITLRAQIELAGRPETAPARAWAMALFASMCGLVVSASFLTLTYHTILWVYLGLVGAFYAAVRSHAPDFRVRFGWRDVVFLCVGNAAMVLFITLYVRLKLG